MLTYRELLERLQSLSELQLNDTVTVARDGEYFTVQGTAITRCDDVLVPDHFYLTVEDPSKYEDQTPDDYDPVYMESLPGYFID